MYRFFTFLICSFLLTFGLSCQQRPVPSRLKTDYAPLNEKLAGMLTADSLALSPQEARQLDDPLYLDAREKPEYNVSHLPGAIRLGFDHPDYGILKNVDRHRPVVVYCTIGYRSEKMAEKIRRRGFTKVYNLYGSIYAWSLAGLPLEDESGNSTRIVHGYNKKWSSYYPDNEKVTY